jgi:hypothetical protein
MASKRAARNIVRLVRKRALERWEINVANCEVMPQPIRLTTNSLTKRGGSKAPAYNSWCPRPYTLSNKKGEYNW